MLKLIWYAKIHMVCSQHVYFQDIYMFWKFYQCQFVNTNFIVKTVTRKSGFYVMNHF